MINLLKGEVYKLIKSRAFYVSCLVAVISVIFIHGMLYTASRIQSGEMENGSAGVVVSKEEMQESSVPLLEEITTLDVLQQMYANFTVFFIAVFISIFVVGEYVNGVIKNVVGKGYARWKIFASKYIMSVLATAFLMLLMTVVAVIIGSFVRKGQVAGGAAFAEILKYVGIQLLICIAYCGVVVTISELCRSMGAGIAVNFAIATFSVVIVIAFDHLVQLILPQSDFKVSSYWLVSLMSECPIKDMGVDFVLHAVIVSVVWIIITAGTGIFHFKKADVK